MTDPLSPSAALPDPEAAAAAAHSRFWQRLSRRYGPQLPMLAEGVPVRPMMDATLAALLEAGYEAGAALRILRQLVLHRVIALDCAARITLHDVTRAMTELAECALGFALEHACQHWSRHHGHPQGSDGQRLPLWIVGMGKLGARELNASSDVDLIYVYEHEGRTTGVDAAGSASLSHQEYFTKVVKTIGTLIADVTEHGFVFRVDLALRPHGSAGPVVMALPALASYLRTHGREWERFAWLKSRVIAPQDARRSAGVQAFRAEVLPFVFRRYLDYGVFDALRELHRQIRAHASRRSAGRPQRDQDVKLSRGGIREVEFIVQLLQVVRGGQFPELRCRSTLQALPRLTRAGLMPGPVAQQLAHAYTFLRNVEHRIQYLDDQQTHALPTRDDDLAWMARTLGYASTGAFLDELHACRECVAQEFDAMLGGAPQGLCADGHCADAAPPHEAPPHALPAAAPRPAVQTPVRPRHPALPGLGPALGVQGPSRAPAPAAAAAPSVAPVAASAAPSLSPSLSPPPGRASGAGGSARLNGEDAAAQWAALLQELPPVLAQRLQDWLDGPRLAALGRTARHRLLRLLRHTARWYASDEGRSPAQRQAGALRFIDWVQPIVRRPSYMALLLERPIVHQRLLHMLGAAAWPARYLQQHPGVVDELASDALFGTRFDPVSFERDMQLRLQSLQRTGEDDDEALLNLLRRAHHGETFRTLARDVEGIITVEQVADDLSALADSLLRLTCQWCWQRLRQRHCDEPRFAIIGYGKLGGKELGYGSDLDIVFLFDDPAEGAQEVYTAYARRLIHWLTVKTGEGDLFEIDTALRPNGNSGLLVTRFDAYASYQQQRGSNTAWTWEHQAMTRARFILGSADLRPRFDAVREGVITAARDHDALRGEIIAMREKMRAARTQRPRRPHGPGGLGAASDTAPPGFDIKHDRGGMVDAEFAVQYLVLAHARAHPALRGNLGNITLLHHAQEAGLLPEGVGSAAAAAYRHLRRVQHTARLNESHEAANALTLAPQRQAIEALWQAVFGPGPRAATA